MKKIWEAVITFVAFAVVITLVLLLVGCGNQKDSKETKNKKFKELTKISTTSVSFDHEGCQYPDRWSNPPEGCDNTDPAIPECIEYMQTQQTEADCIKKYSQQHTQTTQPQTTNQNIRCAQAFADMFNAYNEMRYAATSLSDPENQDIGWQTYNSAEAYAGQKYTEYKDCIDLAPTKPGGTFG